MGKNRLLDIAHNKMTNCIERKKMLYSVVTLISFFSLLITIGFSTACSFPRIIVLDDPLSPEEHLNLGVTYEKQGDLENALNEYKKASKNLARAFVYMGNIYLQKNNFEEAENNYRTAIKKDPQNADAYNNLAWLYYLKKDNLEEAESLAMKAITLNGSKKEIYQDTLNSIRKLKGPKEAD